MIVDDVENDGDAKGMRAVDEAAEIIRSAVQVRGGEEIDAVVAPAEPTGEFRHGHDFKAGDPELGKSRQFARQRLPSFLPG